MSEVLIARTTTGEVVAEGDIGSALVTVEELLESARRAGATVVWAHGGDLASHGFVRMPGFVQLHADVGTASMAEPRLSEIPVTLLDLPADATLATQAFEGQWGHKRPEDAALDSDDGSVVIAAMSKGVAVGMCRIWTEERVIDGPGLVPSVRSAARKAQLLEAACNLLGQGPVQVDTWGEDDETLAAYAELGFTVSVREAGWELRMRRDA